MHNVMINRDTTGNMTAIAINQLATERLKNDYLPLLIIIRIVAHNFPL